jgi:hypothetical protein
MTTNTPKDDDLQSEQEILSSLQEEIHAMHYKPQIVHNGLPDIFIYKSDEMPEGVTNMVIYGSSMTGKTVLMISLLDLFPNHYTILFSPNKNSEIYQEGLKKVKNIWCFSKFIPELIVLLQRINQKNKNKFPFLVIFDDVITAHGSTSMQNLFLTLRNSNISAIVCIQHPKHISPSIRGSVYNEAWFRFNNDEIRKFAIRDFLSSYVKGGIIDYHNLPPYCFFYINNKTGETSINKVAYHKSKK